MSPARRLIRLRLLAVRERELEAELKKTREDRRVIENAVSEALGYRVRLHGPQLLAELDRLLANQPGDGSVLTAAAMRQRYAAGEPVASIASSARRRNGLSTSETRTILFGTGQ